MTAAQMLTSALNLRKRAETEENKERAAAWIKEAAELEAAAAKLTPTKSPAK